MLEAVDAIYASRASGDMATIGPLWAQGATYEMVGAAALLSEVPTGPTGAVPALEELIDMFTFHSVERLSAIIEGNRASVQLAISVSNKSGDRWETRLLDWWEFDDDGKARSLVQFTDTAMLASKLQ